MTITAPDSVRLDTIDIATQEDMPLLLTVEEAAHRLRIGRTQMYQLVKTAKWSPSASADSAASPSNASPLT
jgi:hypothetical protein